MADYVRVKLHLLLRILLLPYSSLIPPDILLCAFVSLLCYECLCVCAFHYGHFPTAAFAEAQRATPVVTVSTTFERTLYHATSSAACLPPLPSLYFPNAKIHLLAVVGPQRAVEAIGVDVLNVW